MTGLCRGCNQELKGGDGLVVPGFHLQCVETCALPECRKPAVQDWYLIGYCNGLHQAIHHERLRIEKILDEQIPHDGYCSMNDCGGCEALSRIKSAINRDTRHDD